MDERCGAMSARGATSDGENLLEKLTRRAISKAGALLARGRGLEVEAEGWFPRSGQAEVEGWLRRQLGVSLKRAVRAERGPRPDAELVGKVGADIRRILAQGQEERSKLAPLVAPVLASPPDRRWQMVTSLPELRRAWFVSSLLDGAELFAEEQGPDAIEELALSALHLAERLSIRSNRRAIVFDLMALAWLLRVRVALERGEREDAAFALELAQLYQERGTGDPLLLFATARASAWLVWIGGDLELAGECFRVMARRASEVRDPALVAEAKAWQSRVRSDRGDDSRHASGSVVAEVGAEEMASVTERVEKSARRLQLPGVA